MTSINKKENKSNAVEKNNCNLFNHLDSNYSQIIEMTSYLLEELISSYSLSKNGFKKLLKDLVNNIQVLSPEERINLIQIWMNDFDEGVNYMCNLMEEDTCILQPVNSIIDIDYYKNCIYAIFKYDSNYKSYL